MCAERTKAPPVNTPLVEMVATRTMGREDRPQRVGISIEQHPH
jgi:hypothetical protein